MLRLFAVMMALAGGVAFVGCGSDRSSSQSASASESGGENLKVSYSNPVGAQPGQQDMFHGFRGAAQELGWKASQIDANLSADKQVADIATMISQGQDGIASWSLDPGAAAGVYKQADEAGIPVVGMASEGTGVDATVWLEVYTCRDGGLVQQLAELIASKKPGGKVIAVGGPPVPALKTFQKCFVEKAKDAGLDVVAEVQNVKDTAATAQPLVADLLTKHGDVDAIWSYNDASSLGASAAVLAAGKKVQSGETEGVMIFGANADAEAIEATKDGRMTGTIDHDLVASGWAMIKALQGLVGKDKSADAPKELVVKGKLFTRENIHEYVEPRKRKFTLDTLPLVETEGS